MKYSFTALLCLTCHTNALANRCIESFTSTTDRKLTPDETVVFQPGSVIPARIDGVHLDNKYLEITVNTLRKKITLTNPEVSYLRANGRVPRKGEKVYVYVKDFDPTKDHLTLAYEPLYQKWRQEVGAYPTGSRVSAKVLKLNEHGMQVEVTPFLTGFIPRKYVEYIDPVSSDVISIGDEITATVNEINLFNQRFLLSMRKLPNIVWDAPQFIHSAGDKYEGVVMNTHNFGVWVRLPSGLDGLIHKSNAGAPIDPKRFNIGTRINVTISEIDFTQKTIALIVPSE